jgi:hypothetical protein
MATINRILRIFQVKKCIQIYSICELDFGGGSAEKLIKKPRDFSLLVVPFNYLDYNQ